MTITMKGHGFTIEELVKIARFNEKVKLDDDALKRIKKCRSLVEKKIKAKEIMYGVNTGIGEFSEIVLDDDKIQEFQKYLVITMQQVSAILHLLNTFEVQWLLALVLKTFLHLSLEMQVNQHLMQGYLIDSYDVHS